MISSPMQLSMESLSIDSSYSDEQTTPCKTPATMASGSKSKLGSALAASENSPISANAPAPTTSATKLRHTNLNSIAGLKPIRPLLLEQDSEVAAVSPPPSETRQDASRPPWNQGFAKPDLTPKRLPWSSDLRMRKATAEPASPRTPHNSQINVKRQKNQSQLSRPSLVPVVASNRAEGEFLQPSLPLPRSNAPVNKPEDLLKTLKQRYEAEVKSKHELEHKYELECKARFKLEMEHSILTKKNHELEAEVATLRERLASFLAETTEE